MAISSNLFNYMKKANLFITLFLIFLCIIINVTMIHKYLELISMGIIILFNSILIYLFCINKENEPKIISIIIYSIIALSFIGFIIFNLKTSFVKFLEPFNKVTTNKWIARFTIGLCTYINKKTLNEEITKELKLLFNSNKITDQIIETKTKQIIESLSSADLNINNSENSFNFLENSIEKIEFKSRVIWIIFLANFSIALTIRILRSM